MTKTNPELDLADAIAECYADPLRFVLVPSCQQSSAQQQQSATSVESTLLRLGRRSAKERGSPAHNDNAMNTVDG